MENKGEMFALFYYLPRGKNLRKIAMTEPKRDKPIPTATIIPKVDKPVIAPPSDALVNKQSERLPNAVAKLVARLVIVEPT